MYIVPIKNFKIKKHRYLERGLKTGSSGITIQTFSIEVWYLKNIKTPRKESWLPNSCQKGLKTVQYEHVKLFRLTMKLF